MKYKVKDKVKIKNTDIFNDHISNQLKEHNFILTISSIDIDIDVYHTKEIDIIWYEDEIEGLIEKFKPITSRFEIIDL